MEYKTLSKKAKHLMTATAFMQSLLLVAVGIAAVIIGDLYGAVKVAVLVSCAVFAIVWAAVFPVLRFKRYKYIITPDRVEIVCGVFFVSRTVVPVNRIHQINVARGPLDTSFGVAKVSVITAGSTAVLRFLDEDKAQELALYLNEKVGKKIGGNSDVQ